MGSVPFSQTEFEQESFEIEQRFSEILGNKDKEEDNTAGEFGEAIKFSEELLEKVNNLPLKPGVYQFKNRSGKVIYVGKAIKIRNRVKSYFASGKTFDAKTIALRRHIFDLEPIITDNETEALILENTLIKELKPKYNILLKDDKSYPYIRITNELYPRIFSTRTVVKDGSKYFGPYTDIRAMNSLLDLLHKVFKFRSCDLNITEESIRNHKHRLCLDYYIGKCEGPCQGLISSAKYNEYVKNAIKIINGRTGELEKHLEGMMISLAEDLKFEEASAIKHKLTLLQEYSSKQKILSNDKIDRDVLGFFIQDEMCCSLIFKIREGKLIGKRQFIFYNVLKTDSDELMTRTLQAWYNESDFVPQEIFLPDDFEGIEQIAQWLTEKNEGKRVNIQVPKIGDKKQLIDMANKNAEFILKEQLLALDKREQIIPRAVLSLQRDLRLQKPPQIIDCFDNSHLQGTDLVSSMVRFEDGKPKKSEYRKYKNKTVLTNNDYATMQEVVRRRYTRILEEQEKSTKAATKLPDLIIVDGGKGQISAALEVLTELNLEKKIPLIGLAERLDEVYFPFQSEALFLPRTSSSLRLMQQIRDEAHRFAITYHRNLRDKRTFHTELTEIDGIGEKTAERLLREIGSVKKIQETGDEELKKYLNGKQIKNLREFFLQKVKE